MQWEEFINDQELNMITEHHHPPDGKYLLGKVGHDVLECLNSYKGSIGLAATIKDDLSETTYNDLSKWLDVIEDWITQIRSIIIHSGEQPIQSPEWAQRIDQIGRIIGDTPNLKALTDSIAIPSKELAKQVVRIAIRNMAKLNLIWLDIRDQNYKRLWTIERYCGLIDQV